MTRNGGCDLQPTSLMCGRERRLPLLRRRRNSPARPAHPRLGAGRDADRELGLDVLSLDHSGPADRERNWLVADLDHRRAVARAPDVGIGCAAVGRAIERNGGRAVLSVGALLCAVGLAGLAASPSLIFYIAAWIVIGLGMAASLYDAAFSTLGRIYGDDARQAITAITLFGGLASTACWPLSAYLNAELGWRGACLIYAGWHLFIAAPAFFFVLPRELQRAAETHARELRGARRAPTNASFRSPRCRDLARRRRFRRDLNSPDDDAASARPDACRRRRARRAGRPVASRLPRRSS